MDNYIPISCDLYDCLEELLNLKRQCCITYLNEKNQFTKIYGQIIAISAAGDADWCRLGDGTKVFLNRIETFES